MSLTLKDEHPAVVGDLPTRLSRLLRDVAACLPDDYLVVADIDPRDHAGAMRELLHAVRFLERVYDGEYGPLATWPGPWTEGMWERLDVRVWVCEDVDCE